MMRETYLSADERLIVVTVPMRVQRRGGRKQVVTPGGVTEAVVNRPARPDNALVHALARAHRWKRMLEGGRHASIRALAEAEKVNES